MMLRALPALLMLTIFAARFVVTAIAYPSLDGDLAWQRWLGRLTLARHAVPRALGTESFTATGAHWTPQEWLFSIVASLAPQGPAWLAFAGGAALCAVAALWFVGERALRRGATPFTTTIVVALAGMGLFESFGVRAQVVAWPCLALFLYVLEREGRARWLCVAVAAVWSNLHASAMLAPVFGGLFALAALAEDRAWTARVRERTLLAAALAIAICCNPFGWGLPLYALSLFGSPIKHFISEWKVTDLDDTSFVTGALPILIALVAYGVARTRASWDWLCVIAASFLLLMGARNIAIYGLIAGAPLAQRLSELLAATRFGRPSSPSAQSERLGRIALVALSGGFAAIVAVALLRNHEARTAESLPRAAVARLAAQPGEHRLLCRDFAWCSLALDYPRLSVFLDGRADPFPPAVWNDYAAVAHLEPGWREVLKRYRVDAVLADSGGTLDQALSLTGWRQAFRDDEFHLWLREGG